MSNDYLSIQELAQRLARDRRIIEKLAQKGAIPGQRIAGEWRFHQTEITHWLEQDLRTMGENELAVVESQHTNAQDGGSPIAQFMSPDTCEACLDAATKPSVLRELINVAGRTWHVWDAPAILKAIQEREEVMSTAFDNGVAVPHPRNPLSGALGQTTIAFGRTTSGIPFGGPRRSLTDLFFLVLAKDSRTHLRILARIARLLQVPDFTQHLRQIDDSADAADFILQTDASIELD